MDYYQWKAYILFGIGTYFDIGWVTAISGAYLAFLRSPISLEKLVTFAIAIVLLKIYFPNDKKTLAALKHFYEKAKQQLNKERRTLRTFQNIWDVLFV